MIENHINTAQGGEEDDYVWVTLHFVSSETENDRIHIVCPTTDEEEGEPGRNALYFERLHQAQGGSGLARLIRVTSSAVELEFTPEGLRQLEFPDSLRLRWSPAVEGYQLARQHFAGMLKHGFRGILETA